MSNTYIITVEATFAIEASSYEDALDKAHDRIQWQGITTDDIGAVYGEQWNEEVSA